ncbi:MAG: 2-hydroxyglutaryl-CoA dehydratase [Armatimonadota bacterium]|nr:MAG: 2-hydroxyglutaryl-CoA dehydratase [Armatimonadota bacterium]
MLVCGVDVGCMFTKFVILRDGAPVAQHIMESSADGAAAISETLAQLLASVNSNSADLKAVVSCGLGRRSVVPLDKVISEISACAGGARAVHARARTLIDLGAHGIRVAALDERGRVANFDISDKCASGTGCFLDIMSRALGVEPLEAGKVALCARNPEQIESMCAVFGESEVVSLVARGSSREDILGGLVEAVSRRVASMVKRVGMEQDILLAGGVAKNAALRTALEKALGSPVHLPDEPQTVGALGAALVAQRLASGERR